MYFLNVYKTDYDSEHLLFCEASSSLKVVDGYVHIEMGTVKTTMRYNYLPVGLEWPKSGALITSNGGQLESSYIAGGNAK